MQAINLKKAMKNARITQARLAELFEVAPNTVWRWCSGVSEPDDETKKKLSSLLGTSVAYLMGEISDASSLATRTSDNYHSNKTQNEQFYAFAPPSMDKFSQAREAARYAAALNPEDLEAACLMLRSALRDLEKAKELKEE